MSIVPADSERLFFMPETDVLKAKGTVIAYHDYYCVCHPTKGITFYCHDKKKGYRAAHLQANTNEEISIRIRDQMYPWAVIKKIPLLLVPMNPNDY